MTYLTINLCSIGDQLFGIENQWLIFLGTQGGPEVLPIS